MKNIFLTRCPRCKELLYLSQEDMNSIGYKFRGKEDCASMICPYCSHDFFARKDNFEEVDIESFLNPTRF